MGTNITNPITRAAVAAVGQGPTHLTTESITLIPKAEDAAGEEVEEDTTAVEEEEAEEGTLINTKKSVPCPSQRKYQKV